MNTVSFHCNACGRCCDSPPTMTIPELFHHEGRFVGCLAIRRVPRHRPHEELACGERAHRVSAEDVTEADALADRLLFTASARYSIATQAIDYASLGGCPARLADGRCDIHNDRKPATCGTVPLDPLLPDRLQHVVLMSRRLGEGYGRVDCIAAGKSEGYAVLVDGGEVVDAGYRAGMVQQRDALAAEKAAWGEAVFALLKRELFDDPAQARRIPASGYLSLPLVPVLMVLAERSSESRDRCLRYAQRQQALIAAKVAQAVGRKRAEDKPLTQELRRFSQAYEHFEKA